MRANKFGFSGTSGVSAFISLENIPAIITEWSALVPLVCHLADYGEDHRMVGELSLAGHLTVALFPKLGYLDGISRLLEGVPDFSDRANAKSESSYKVWDVNWGSVFTRANGSAISIVTNYALRYHRDLVEMPEEVLAEPIHLLTPTPAAAPRPVVGTAGPVKPIFRRNQDLHVIRMSRTSQFRSVSKSLLRMVPSRVGEIAYHLMLVGTVVVLCLLGAFGSAAILVNGLLSKLVCRLLRTERPCGYLENNENHEACMLSAVHENASTWYLYIGDRGVIDWLLNKTMLTTPSASRLQVHYFRFAHLLQLLAMTFVAAQKGIDGISLVMLVLANYGFQYIFGGHHIARRWLQAEGVSVDAHSFRFSGRTPMIGAIHTINEARDAAWIDTLLVPCPRIRIWLDELKCDADTRSQLNQDMQNLSLSDRSWVLLNAQLAIQAARIIRQELNYEKEAESLHVSESSRRT